MRTDDRYPGGGAIPVEPDDPCPEYGWYSMELPNLIENSLQPLRETFSRSGLERIDISASPHHGIYGESWVECFYFTVEYEEAVREVGEYTSSRDFARYTLERKKLIGPLITEDPSPYSNIYMVPSTDRDV
ncbi:hypothetical protein CJF30_00004378 [Rutstroemia sp. NJR-2017a BBW]|nr:hypothetical protein CJF30_00004378 [Rutstroemia sp. NJR-2017a BBW]